jgi:hypothetical protein
MDAATGIILMLIITPIVAIYGEGILKGLANAFRKMNGG